MTDKEALQKFEDFLMHFKDQPADRVKNVLQQWAKSFPASPLLLRDLRMCLYPMDTVKQHYFDQFNKIMTQAQEDLRDGQERNRS